MCIEKLMTIIQKSFQNIPIQGIKDKLIIDYNLVLKILKKRFIH